MKIKVAIFIPFLFLVTAAAEAKVQQERSPLSLDEAVRIALAHHPRLRRAQHQIEAAEARLRQAKSTYFPQVDVGGVAKKGLSGSGSAFGLHGLASSPKPEDMAVSVNVYQDLFDFGRTKHERGARRPEVVYFQESLLAEKARVVLEVRKAYYRALKAGKLTEIAQQTVKERRLTLRQARAFYRAQLRSKLDVSLAHVEVSRAELDLVRAQNGLAQAFAVLNHAMGIEGPDGQYSLQEPDIEIEAPEALENLLAAGLEARPELHAAEARIAAHEQWVEKARSERYPRFMGAFSGGWTRFAELTLDKLLFGGFAFKWPLFTGKRLESEIEEARRDLDEVKAKRDNVSRSIRLGIQTAYHDLVATMQAVKAGEEIVKQAEEAVRLARARYRMELSDFVELVTAQTAHIGAQSEYAQAVYDYKIKQSELRYAVGAF